MIFDIFVDAMQLVVPKSKIDERRQIVPSHDLQGSFVNFFDLDSLDALQITVIARSILYHVFVAQCCQKSFVVLLFFLYLYQLFRRIKLPDIRKILVLNPFKIFLLW